MKKLISFSIIFLVCAIPIKAQSILSEFENFNTDGSVHAMEYDEANDIVYIGGNFSRAGDRYRNGAAVNVSGDIPGGYPRVNNWVEVAVPDGAGGYYIGGRFTEVGGVSRSRLAQIDASGNVTSWDPSVSGTVVDILVDGNTVYICGSFNSIGGQSRSKIGAIDATTGVATSWNPDANSSVETMAKDGNIMYIGGYFTEVGGLSRSRIAAIDLTTGVPTSWDPGASDRVFALAVSSGNVYAGGYFTSMAGVGRDRLASITTSGLLNTWNPAPNFKVDDILINSGTIYVGGDFTTIDGESRSKLASFDESDGSLTSWDPETNVRVSTMALNGSGFLFVGGGSGFAIVSTSTGEEGFFDTGWQGACYGLAISGSTVYLGGSGSLGGEKRNNIAAIDAATGEVTSWDPSPNNLVEEILINENDVLVGGFFSEIGGENRGALAAIDASTGLATAWNPSVNNGVYDMLISGNDLYIGGFFTEVGGQSRNRIASVNVNTGSVNSWNPDANARVNSILLSENNSIYVGGDFSTVGGENRNYIAEIDLTTGAASSWDPNADEEVLDLDLGMDGTIYVAGRYNNIGGQSRSHLAALDPVTGTVTSWDPAPDRRYVEAVTVAGEVIYAMGEFDNIAGQSQDGIAALTTSGSLINWGSNMEMGNSRYQILESGLSTFLASSTIVLDGELFAGFVAVTRPNGSPTDIQISNASINENRSPGQLIGSFTSADETGDTHIYTLASGNGDDDNGSFSTSGSDLLSGEAFDFETKDSYTVRVRSEDNSGFGREEIFAITINNVIEKSNAIVSFTIPGQLSASVIDVTSSTVTLNMGHEADRSNLTPTIEISSGSTISPLTDIPQNFTGVVDYTVTAENGVSKVWQVAVTSKLEGTYSVGSTGDFTTLDAALDDLTTFGLAGDVVFEVEDGYDEEETVILVNPDPVHNVIVRPENGATSVHFRAEFDVFRVLSDLSNFILDGADPVSGNIVFNIHTGIFDGLSFSGPRALDFTVSSVRFYIADGEGIDTGSSTSELSGLTVENCEFVATNVDGFATIRAIYLRRLNLDNIIVKGNKFYNQAGTPDPASYGAILGFDFIDEVINNSISIRAESTTGIRKGSLTYNNSIHIYGNGSEVGSSHRATSQSGVLNNIINIERTAGTGTVKMAIHDLNAHVGHVNNNIFIADDGVSSIEYAQNATTKEAFEAIVPTTTFDQSTFNDITVADLSLTGASLSNANLRATPLAEVTTDIDGVTRSINAVSKGAYESPNNIADITAFMFSDQVGDAVIASDNLTIEAILDPIGTLSNVTPTIESFPGSTINPISGVAQDFTTSIIYSVTAEAGNTEDWTVTIDLNDVSEAPTDISLDNSSIDENEVSGTLVGSLSTTDVDAGETYTYTLMSGTGDTDNASFTIDGDDLKSATIFDFETKDSYSIRVNTNDGNGGDFAKEFTISIDDVSESPTDIALDNTSIDENEAAGTVVGILSTSDVDAGETYTYTLVSGSGDTDNASFSIDGNELRSAEMFDFETKDSYSIRINTNDGNGGNFEKPFTISINDISETPTDISLSSTSIDENAATETVVGTLSTIDSDAGETFTYSLAAGSGDTDNASFSINGSDLESTEVFDFETKDSYSIRINTNDGNGGNFEKSFTISINDLQEIIEWNGTSWSNGAGPTASDNALINGDYSTAVEGDIVANNLTTNAGFPITVGDGTYIEVNGDLTHNGTNLEFVVESGGSLVTKGNVTGNFTIERITTFNENTGRYSVVGTPIIGATTYNVLGTNAVVYSYDETQPYNVLGNEGLDRFVNLAQQVNTAIYPGRGYFSAKTGDASGRIFFTGTPNFGTVGVSLSLTDHPAEEDMFEGFNLVSNPYPCAIDYTSFISENSSDIEGAIYIWDDFDSETTRGTNADYVVINAIGNVDSRKAGLSKWDGHIRSMQGFFVQTKDSGDKELDFTDAMKVTANNDAGGFYRTTNDQTSFKLVLESSEGDYAETLIGMKEEASLEADQLDARLFSPAKTTIYSQIGGEPYAIQSLPRVEALEIPLGIKTETQSTYEISIDESENLEGYTILLKDHLLNKSIEISSGDTHRFSSSESISNNRFSVLITNSSAILGLEDGKVFIYTSNNILHIQQEDSESREYQLFNMNGQRLLSTTVQSKAEVDLSTYAKGIYLVFDGEKTHKIILK